MIRKQPIPTTFLSNQSLDILDKMVFAYLWSMTRNEDWFVNFYHGNKYFSYELKRWQVILKVKAISDQVGVSYKRVKRSIEKIHKTENKMAIEKKSFWQVITWENYDERIKMKSKEERNEQAMNKLRKAKKTESEASNKSDKIEEIVKSVETEKNTLSKDKEAEPEKELSDFDLTFLGVEPIEPKKKEYGDKDVNKCLEIIKNANGWIIDWTIKENRKYAKHLVNKINKLDKISSGDRLRQDYLKWLLVLASKSKYDIRKITWPKIIFDNLASLQQVANQIQNDGWKNNDLVSTVEL